MGLIAGVVVLLLAVSRLIEGEYIRAALLFVVAVLGFEAGIWFRRMARRFAKPS